MSYGTAIPIIAGLAAGIAFLIGSTLTSVLYTPASAATLVPLENNDNWFSKPFVVAANTVANNPQAAVSGDNVYLVWESGDVFFAKSSDGGKTFSSPVSLATWNPRSSVFHGPQITIFQDNVYIVYTSGKDIFLLRSTDSGKTFSSPINVSKMGVEKDPYSVVYRPIISLADGGKRVYVGWIVWQQMYFSQSSDGGITFSPHTNVSKEGETVLSANIAAASRNIYLTWFSVDENNRYYISFGRSNDGGNTFESISNISANKPPHSSYEPQVAIGGGSSDGSTVYLVWRDEVPINPEISNLDAKIALAKSTDYGRTFNITRYVGSGLWPTLSVSGKNIYIASGIQENGSDNIGFVESLDGGQTFSKQIMLSNQIWPLNPYDDRPYPAISSGGANVFVGWRYTAGADSKDNSSNHETFLAASYDEGRTFTRQLNISASATGDTRSQPVVVAAPVDRVFVFWPEETLLKNNNTAASNNDILLFRSQIPQEYTEPYRQVSIMTPVQPYNPAFSMIGVIGASIAAGVGTVLYYRHRKKGRL